MQKYFGEIYRGITCGLCIKCRDNFQGVEADECPECGRSIDPKRLCSHSCYRVTCPLSHRRWDNCDFQLIDDDAVLTRFVQCNHFGAQDIIPKDNRG